MPSHDPLRPAFDAAREGDDRAIATLVRATQPAVWRLCSILGQPGEPADLAQETYLRVLKSMHTFRGDSPVLPWVLSIARRVCADHVRRTQRHRRLIDRVGRLGVARDPEHGSMGRNDDGSVVQLIESIDPDRRDAFVLTQYIGLSYDEAALVIGCPVGTIRSRVARARADLMEAVKDADAV